MQTVVIADDHALVRKAYKMNIEQLGNYAVVAEAENGLVLLQVLQQLSQLPDIAFIDLRMPVIDGVATIDIISFLHPSIKCIGISQYSQPNIVVDTLFAGAKGFLQKGYENELDELFNTLKSEQLYVSKNQCAALLFYKECSQKNLDKEAMINLLNKKEILFLKLIAHGLSYEEIAKLLFVSISTLNSYQTSIKDKTSFADKHRQILFAQQNGIVKSLKIPPPPRSIYSSTTIKKANSYSTGFFQN